MPMRVDRRIGGDGADHHRNIVFAAARIDDVGEQEGLTLRLVEAADELPAHQRVQLCILVDRPVDGAQQAALLKDVKMLVKIAVAARRLRHVVFPGTREVLAAGGVDFDAGDNRRSDRFRHHLDGAAGALGDAEQQPLQ